MARFPGPRLPSYILNEPPQKKSVETSRPQQGLLYLVGPLIGPTSPY